MPISVINYYFELKDKIIILLKIKLFLLFIKQIEYY